MKIIFVGVHNKPNTPPLHSSTKTGKIVDKIADAFLNHEIVKTNLFDVDLFPKSTKERRLLKIDFVNRMGNVSNDIVVLLGAEVHRNTPQNSLGAKKIIKIAHPASTVYHRSKEQTVEYIQNAVKQIKEALWQSQ